MQVELLPQADNWREVYKAFITERGIQLRGGLIFGLGGNGPEQGAIGLLHHLNGALRKALTLRFPELPADVTGDILSIQSQPVQNQPGALHHVVAHAVSR